MGRQRDQVINISEKRIKTNYPPVIHRRFPFVLTNSVLCDMPTTKIYTVCAHRLYFCLFVIRNAVPLHRFSGPNTNLNSNLQTKLKGKKIMKKILMTMVAVFAAMNMNAQVYVGGSLAIEAWSSQVRARPYSRSCLKSVTT